MLKAKRSALIVALAMCGTGMARAVEFPVHEPEFPPRAYTCRYDGENLPLGARRCLNTPQGQRVAECVVAINMSSWRPGAASCS